MFLHVVQLHGITDYLHVVLLYLMSHCGLIIVPLQVMPSFSFLEEFSVIRAKYKTAFSDLMHAASQTIGTDVS